jgi:CheY-like chemotaxis protein/nitrogen-specific signal transduction histidine kinase
MSDDGSAVPVHVTVSPLPLEGAPVVCAIVTDLTRQKQFDELRVAQQLLVDADRRKDEFLATLAHELRNPLAPLRNGLQIIELAQRDQRVLKDAQAMMKRQLQNMVRLIDDLLDISRITLGRLELRRESVSLADVIRGAVEVARPALTENGQSLQVSLADDPLYVMADPVRLAQVISSLLANAGRFTGRGGRIELRALREGGTAVVKVRDDGAGIPATLLPHLFEMFPGPEKTAERMNAGFGVALSIAAQLIELHGGSITAKSEGKNQGSEYTFRLPLAAPAPVTTPVPPAPERRSPCERTMPAEQRRRRILVADDDMDSASSLAQLLTLSGHDVRTAYRGTEAFDLADWFRPHIALLDLSIPDEDGYEICRRIKRQPWGRTVTLIAITGWDQPSHEAASREAGFEHHLVKPIEPSQLMALLDRLPDTATDELLG